MRLSSGFVRASLCFSPQNWDKRSSNWPDFVWSETTGKKEQRISWKSKWPCILLPSHFICGILTHKFNFIL